MIITVQAWTHKKFSDGRVLGKEKRKWTKRKTLYVKGLFYYLPSVFQIPLFLGEKWDQPLSTTTQCPQDCRKKKVTFVHGTVKFIAHSVIALLSSLWVLWFVGIRAFSIFLFVCCRPEMNLTSLSPRLPWLTQPILQRTRVYNIGWVDESCSHTTVGEMLSHLASMLICFLWLYPSAMV